MSRGGDAQAATRGAHVVSVHLSAVHDFSKSTSQAIRLLAGLGVEGDAHCGTTVRHRYDRRRDPSRPNLRQVHLMPVELLDEMAPQGHAIRPGDLGENVTTSGVDLMHLPAGTVLRLGEQAEVRLTGLRTPCPLVDAFQAGLAEKLWVVDAHGNRRPNVGVMAVVRAGGAVRPGDPLTVVPAAEQAAPLGPV